MTTALAMDHRIDWSPVHLLLTSTLTSTLTTVNSAGDVEAVEDFVAIGKDINEQDGEGRTALHYAVAYNNVRHSNVFVIIACVCYIGL